MKPKMSSDKIEINSRRMVMKIKEHHSLQIGNFLCIKGSS